ncbi:MAG: penicillin acylase family protein, partial [Solirubrobacteraceae bacterium]
MGIAVACLACGFVLALSGVAGAAETLEDFSGGAYQILPPGAEGSFSQGKFSKDQKTLYERLTPHKGNVTQALLEKDFLPEKFGVSGTPLREEKTPRGTKLKIVRDSHDIPHITGATRGDVMYGSGWVAAEDRGLLLKLGLGPAYTAALSIPGINAFGLLLTQRSFKPSSEAIEFVTKQKSTLEAKGAEGFQVIEDLEQWVEGVNAWEAQASPGPEKLEKPVTFSDAIAGFAFIGSIFGNGGGNEVRNSEFLGRLEAKFGEEGGRQIFRDLKNSNDPEAPTTTSQSFPYDQEPSGATPGTPQVEPGTTSASAVKAASALTASRRKASNFLLA